MNKTSEGVCIAQSVQLSCYGFAHKWSHKSAPLRKEEGLKEGPLMVSGQCGQQLLQYVVCEENCRKEESGQKQLESKVEVGASEGDLDRPQYLF